MIWTILQIVIGITALWIIGNYLVVKYRLRRYNKMLATITHEEVQKMAKTITWKPGDPKEPPALQAWEQLFNQRRKEWGYPTKEE